MTKSIIQLGKAGRRAVNLPIEVVTRTTAVMGIRGSGKSHTASVVVEDAIAAGQQVIVIDPTDSWWGLRSSRSGKSPGLPVAIFGGYHEDLPLNEEAGRRLADLLVERRISAVFALRKLRKAAQNRFLRAFAEQLYHRKGEANNRSPCLIVCDECDQYIPQMVRGPVAGLVGAFEDLVRRGRSSGIGLILISQRPQSVNKDVLTQADTLIAHRVTHEKDRKAFDAWIAAHDTEGRRDEFMGSLASLKTGEAWLWSPEFLDVFTQMRIRERRTFDSSATPKIGERHVMPQKVAKVNLASLQAALSDLIEHKATNEPAALRRTIAELERKLSGIKPVVDVAAIRDTVKRAVSQRDDQWRAVIDKLKADMTSTVGSVLASVEAPVEAPIQTADNPSPSGKHGANRHLAKPFKDISTSTELGGGKLRMMTAIAQHPQGLTTKKLAILATIAPKGGTFRTYLGQLKALGYAQTRGGVVIPMEAGINALGDFEPLPTGEELINLWRQRLGGGGKRRLFDTLIEVSPNSLTRDELGERSDIAPSGGTFRTYLGQLMTLELVERTADDEFRASEELLT